MIVHDVEQNTDEWLRLRAGMPTASEFSRMITAKGEASEQLDGYAAQLAAELYAGRALDRWEGNRWTERGHELEDEARAAYEFIYGVTIERVGFVTNHDVGCSPDGLVDVDGLTEFKCLSAKEHVIALDYFARNQRCQAFYIPQARGQMFVTDRQWNDLFFYHPNLPPLRIRISRELRYDSALVRQIRATITERDRFVDVIRKAA